MRDLVIPPAWRDVWVTPYENGHLQAVGTDDAGRRQYLYHPAWRSAGTRRSSTGCWPFGHALAQARELIITDLGREGLPLERACAAAVRLLDLGYFRIGNDVYADANGSFGLTTLERRHVRRRQDRLVFAFTGKSGVDHRIEIDDAVVIETIEAMRRRRGTTDRLLSYKDGRSLAGLLPALVNEYVRTSTGLEATAKDFRTWHATVLAAAALAETPEPGESKASRKRAVAGAMKEVASFLGNTPTLARSSYVDPRVVDAYERGPHHRARDPAHYDSADDAPGRAGACDAEADRRRPDADHGGAGRHHDPARSTRWSTRRTARCAGGGESTARSTGRAVPRCSPTASRASPTGWRPATRAGRPRATCRRAG